MKQKKNKRKALYIKARNIIRNNMQEHYQTVKLTKANAWMFVRAFNLFQGQRQELRMQQGIYRDALNRKIAESN